MFALLLAVSLLVVVGMLVIWLFLPFGCLLMQVWVVCLLMGVFYCALRVLVCCRIACDCDCLVGGVAVFRGCYGGLKACVVFVLNDLLACYVLLFVMCIV